VSVFAQGECQPPPAQACGSRGLPQCDDGSFCSFPPEANCGRADAPGECTVRSQILPLHLPARVRLRRRDLQQQLHCFLAGVSIEHDGACEAAAP